MEERKPWPCISSPNRYTGCIGPAECAELIGPGCIFGKEKPFLNLVGSNVRRCPRPGCGKPFRKEGNRRFCSDTCRELVQAGKSRK